MCFESGDFVLICINVGKDFDGSGYGSRKNPGHGYFAIKDTKPREGIASVN